MPCSTKCTELYVDVVQALKRPLGKRSESPEGKLAKGLGVCQVTLGKR